MTTCSPIQTAGHCRDRQITELFAEVGQPQPTPAERRVFVDMPAESFEVFANRMRSAYAEAKAAVRLEPSAVYAARRAH